MAGEERAALIESILESSTAHAIVAADLEATIVEWNHGARLLYGYEAAEVMNRARASIVFEPDDVKRGRVQRILDTVREAGSWAGGLLHFRKGGAAFAASVTITLRRDRAGVPLGFTMIAHARQSDITEHRRLEQQILEQNRRLTESAEFMSSLLEASTQHSIIAKDLDGTIIAWNEGARRNYGYSAEDMIGKHDFRILHVPEDVASGRIEELLRASRETGKAEGVFERVRKDGARFTALLAVTLRRDVTGVPVGYVMIETDITQKVALEKQLLRNDELEEQNVRVLEATRQKSEFLANMSHELRTPLNGIIGLAELMHDEKVGPIASNHREYLGDILTSSNHLLQLINDVLDLAKVESGTLELRPEPMSTKRLVGEICDILRAISAAKRIQIECEIDPAVEQVVADPAKLKQVLYNYLSNALKFTSDGGRIVVRASREGPDDVRIEVIDTGIGIRAEDFDQLFVEFRQLDAGAAKRYAGTGLGLALTRRIVEAQGGRVGVTSVFGRGTTFFAILPRLARSLDVAVCA